MSTPRRVLILSHVSALMGGAERSLLELLKDLKSAGCACCVIVPGDGSVKNAVERMGVECSVIPFRWWIDLTRSAPWTFRGGREDADAIGRMVALIETVRPDVCISNTLATPVLAVAAALTLVTHAWFVREYATGPSDIRFAIPGERAMQLIGALSDAAFYNSEALRTFYSSNIRTPASIVAYPFVEEPALSQGFTSPFSSDLKLVVVGAIKPAKGQLDAVQALGVVRGKGIDAQLCLVGNEEDKGYIHDIKRYVQDRSLDEWVMFTGHQDNPCDYVHAADVGLGCSRHEAFGRFAVEYIKGGKPVVASGTGGIHEIISDGRTGLLYSPGNYEELADKILRLYRDGDLVESLVQAAKADVALRFSRHRTHQPVIDFIDRTPARTALDLSILAGLHEKRQSEKELEAELARTRQQVAVLRQTLQDIHDSASWRILRSVRSVTARKRVRP